ncbi:hypothetical protein HQ346_18160 [Rhodococcus sp. BP-252]|uniref:DoxX-like family protein n=1 Tax=Rhodococcoides kyotonense TaxID=398843 RepID=A0A177Y972_9NOCA|nr:MULTISPECIES: hypothetical protein [Rhodococcus]MBY6413698.1 hypothetical protein [Rhodococcus sp. BP-320]MBY6418315.1 hypothetical protein [Rhodococcus sp. BP-321]MBY6422440.1 hypothetical protein [Rhodococcus sp. BP-324]MBY6428260.1 hypothetical protein [Rhodococcus sp. BP-323]MBY6433437.1 hypothetical protein [Rhodococcus sp. BP-322]
MSKSTESGGFLPKVLGIGLAATGAAHFVVPEAFEGITKLPFPKDTRSWISRNGATELAVGTAIALPQTRKLGLVGLGAYVGWLGYNVARNS